VNPFAAELVAKLGYPAEMLRSKGWEEFEAPDAPHMDIVITVCDNAAGEVCPIWPGHPMTAHWGFEDPAAVEGSDEEKRAAFSRIFREIAQRVDLLIQLPVDKLDHLALSSEVRAIGTQ